MEISGYRQREETVWNRERSLNRADVDTIYVCTDSGQEENISTASSRKMAGVQGKKQKRVWIDSQTEEEILRGIREARSVEYDHLADSAYLQAKRLSDGN